jgi:hypothetical protein
MYVTTSTHSNYIFFNFHPDEKDNKIVEPVFMYQRSCFFELPFCPKDKPIHSDLLAFSIVLLCFPFVRNEIVLDFPVSYAFRNKVKSCLDIDLVNYDVNLPVRSVVSGRPGLAYSGGVDSSAALKLMPKDSVIVFLDRISPEFKKTLYIKSAAHQAVREVAREYQNVFKVASDMEHIRSRVGFPVDMERPDINYASAIPLILSADYFSIDSIAYGAVLESIYNLGHDSFDNYIQSRHYKKWAGLFEINSLDLFLPVAGVSEVGTSIIVYKSGFSKQIRSCMRGDNFEPCKKCIKCFRKLSLDYAIQDIDINEREVIDNINSNEVVTNLWGKIKHENVYRYISCNMRGAANGIFDELYKRVSIENEVVSWMERWYPESIELIPAKYRDEFKIKLLNLLDPMTNQDIKFVESWHSQDKEIDTERLERWQSYVLSLVKDERLKEKFKSKNKLVRKNKTNRLLNLVRLFDK